VVRGANSAAICCGPAGGGKSYTMFGEQQNPGLMPRAITELFRVLQQAPSSSVASAGTSRLLDFAALESHNNNKQETTTSAAEGKAVRPFRVSMSLVEVGEKGVRDLLAPSWPSGATKWNDSVRA